MIDGYNVVNNWREFKAVREESLEHACEMLIAAAAEYAAITLRKLRKHYGPINRKEAQFKQEVVDLLIDIEKQVDANVSLCSEL